ncbi:MAG: FKBP-type peptidyl-prolyl cis-trans isomerase [Bacteroidia bacterium]
MKFTIKLSIATVAVFSLFTACKNPSGNSFDTDPTTGVQYHFFNHDDKGAKPAIGDYAQVYLVLKNSGDSVIFDSRHKKRKEDTTLTVNMHLVNNFKGDLHSGITMMAVGDSAVFSINADSLYLKSFQSKQLPPFVKAGSMVTFNVKLASFETPQQMSDDIDRRIKERQAMMEKRKADESAAIQKFLTDSNIKAKPESDGIYILKRVKGKGKPIKEGDSVEVKYTGMLLDGAVAETSDHGAGNTTFTLVYGKDHFIKGFDDIITNLEEGGSVRALIPSALAYGEDQNGMILPYTPLLYDVEIIKVK